MHKGDRNTSPQKNQPEKHHDYNRRFYWIKFSVKIRLLA